MSGKRGPSAVVVRADERRGARQVEVIGHDHQVARRPRRARARRRRSSGARIARRAAPSCARRARPCRPSAPRRGARAPACTRRARPRTSPKQRLPAWPATRGRGHVRAGRGRGSSPGRRACRRRRRGRSRARRPTRGLERHALADGEDAVLEARGDGRRGRLRDRRHGPAIRLHSRDYARISSASASQTSAGA